MIVNALDILLSSCEVFYGKLVKASRFSTTSNGDYSSTSLHRTVTHLRRLQTPKQALKAVDEIKAPLPALYA